MLQNDRPVGSNKVLASFLPADERHRQAKGPIACDRLSRRDCLTSAAATALGYMLAAGPVRAAAIKTGTEGLS
jgi:hypothetical protein